MLEAKIRNACFSQLKELEKKKRLYDSLLKILEPLDGKPINKAIETQIGKALPLYTVAQKTEWGGHYVYIWGNGINYDKRLCFSLGAGTIKTYNDTNTSPRSFTDLNKEYSQDLPKQLEQVYEWIEDHEKARELASCFEDYLSRKDILLSTLELCPFKKAVKREIVGLDLQ